MAGRGGIGPALPPHLQKQHEEEDEEDSSTTHSIGPALPPHLRKQQQDEEESSTTRNIGPALPPHLRKQHVEEEEESSTTHSIGPALPPHLRKQLQQQQEEEEEEAGPPLPSSAHARRDEEEEEEEDVGPMPVPAEVAKAFDELGQREALSLFEQRADKMRRKLDGEPEDAAAAGPAVRETWMLELPEKMRKNFGSGPRSFRRRYDDTSDDGGWTDTPNQPKKEKPRAEERRGPQPPTAAEVSARDESLSRLVQEYNNTHRPQSLMEIHQKKQIDEFRKNGPEARRPHGRDEGASVHIDPKRKKEFIESAATFNSKFTSSKFM